ncbi:translesion error-prone DNA polymerase V autoproteolytic subunit [Rudanella paleaurantiibacter]|uniref:Translesion error-prone DNA polymerase V autoproteolytic subunit n=1 Tax=Rudanella paleaurantiibacter TaxID=2614655 RepID=A0A7J5TT16_9BACT|nr:translesion error-prone DNA polymerase V autoproteolytic subunit [Rudanella paleaurantiibacter]KAB7726688.1 translesion error-prone DNA polymerase V autoproteolytic subunit [Rudanella paleaurantiibacter]
MIPCSEQLLPGELVKAKRTTRYLIPFFSSRVQAGFPSPATDYIERVCDLNDLCITNPEATYFVRAAGDSMIGDRIEPGDILIVDSSFDHVDGRIAVVSLNGDNLVKRVRLAGEMIVLLSSNDEYDPIYVHKGENFRVFGVVTWVIQKPR